MTGIMQAMVGGFFGLTNPVVFDFSAGSNAIVTAPAGAKQVVIEVWAGGGGGSHGIGTTPDTFDFGNKGASGGYSRSVYDCASLQTLHYTVGAGGIGQPAGDNTDYNGAASIVASGTLTITTLTAGGGGGADTANLGAGGTAAGGNDANTHGNADGSPVLGLNGNSGGGGGGSSVGPVDGHPGGVGRVIFTFT